jgi:hypothetical protein
MTIVILPAARYGDSLYPERSVRGDAVFLRLNDAEGQPHAVMEFNSR